jgi:hypothetical protein
LAREVIVRSQFLGFLIKRVTAAWAYRVIALWSA